GVAFFALLAFFPAVTAFVSLYGLFADASTIQDHLNLVASFMPGGAYEVVREQVVRVVSKPPSTLGLTFIVSTAFGLWSANAGMKAIFDALNVAYEETEKRSFIRLNLVSLCFTLGAFVGLALALAAVIVFPLVLSAIGLSGWVETIIWVLRWPALLALV